VFHPTRSRVLLVLASTALALAVTPVLAEAQRRGPGPRGPAVRQVRQVVYVGSGWGYPRGVFYDSWYQGWGPYGPYGPYAPYGPAGYRYGLRDDLTSSIRLDVTPREAEVFVDGYAAGLVDDFDGVFQRLRLRPGEHDLTIYLAGHRSVRQSLYLNPGSDQKVRFTLEPLGAGEAAEPRPTPEPREARGGEELDRPAPPDRSRPVQRSAEREPEARVEPQVARAIFGSLSIRVQPGDAEILVDGERWATPAGLERVLIQLSEGRHRIEVRKDGFARYTEEVLVRRNATLTLNVSLLKGD
jgi:hypothetical protein